MTNCLHPIGWGVNVITGERFAIPCKSNDCIICRQVNKNKLSDRVALYFTDVEVTYFCTLTKRFGSNRDFKKDLVRFRKTMHTGLKVRDPVTKEWVYKWLPRPKFKAFWVFELQKNGTLHAHGALGLDEPMSKEELTQRWMNATHGESWQVDISETKLESVAGYMMKYMTKQFSVDDEYMNVGEHQFKKYERRYSFWKPEGVKTVPWQVWGNAPKVKPGEIQVELGGFWNKDSKYWLDYEKRVKSPGIRLKLVVKDDPYGLPDEIVDIRIKTGVGKEWTEKGWYNVMQERIGPAFINYMDYMLSGFITKWNIDDLNGWHYKQAVTFRRSGGGGKRLHSTGDYKLAEEVLMDLIK